VSRADPAVRAATRLRKRAFRDEARRFLVEGAQGVREALAEAPPALAEVFTADPLDPLALAAAEAGVPVRDVGAGGIGRIASTVTPQAVVGVAPYVDRPIEELAGDGCVAILHEVRDPGNAGTVLRSADAADATGVVFTRASVDVYNPKTVRASAGSVFHLPIVRDAPLADAVTALRGRGFRVLAMAGDGAQSLYATDLTGPVAFLFGNEAQGLGPEDRALADAVVHVPQHGRAESLNLAAAGTICLFEWARRRRTSAPALETLIAAAAHDIRSPLTALKGFGYTLERRWAEMGEEERALMLTGILHDADRMEQVVRLLVDAARVAAGALDLFPESVDLGALVAQVVTQQSRDPDHPAVTFAGDPGPFFVDPARLRSAILASCEALVWWGADGDVRIVGRRDGDMLILTASRRAATAFSPEELEGLYAPRAPGTGGGSKIGLYVVRGVARAQGGDAWAALDGEDLTLSLRVPLAG